MIEIKLYCISTYKGMRLLVKNHRSKMMADGQINGQIFAHIVIFIRTEFFFINCPKES